LTCRDLLNVSHGARNDFVKPATTSGDGADKARATFDPRWADFIFGYAVRDKNLLIPLPLSGSVPELPHVAKVG
jgi:hypothetical protein